MVTHELGHKSTDYNHCIHCKVPAKTILFSFIIFKFCQLNEEDTSDKSKFDNQKEIRKEQQEFYKYFSRTNLTKSIALIMLLCMVAFDSLLQQEILNLDLAVISAGCF